MPFFPVEPVVRQPRLALISLLACLPWCMPASAITFQTRMERVEWKVEGDQFECRLTQPVADFGSGEFVRRAGEQATFRLKMRERWLGPGSATLLAAAAPWQAGRGDINLGALAVGSGAVPFNSNQEQAGRLLAGLMEGRSPLVRHRTLQGGDSIEVRLLPIRFNQAYSDYLKCTAGLLPVNFDQIRQTQIGFSGGGTALDPLGQAKLDIILDFLKADPSVNRIQLDGHSDNSGSRLTNRDTSRRRALAVEEYLKANGVAAEQILVRFHGERYPLAPNNSESNRAKNRRVTMTLSREAVPETPAETAPATPPAAEPAAPAPPAKAASLS
ncbi:OmpA family protein [Pseudomonas sp. UL070]|uniref:OmpA family protein n=2 Tax=Aquipseudomonas ullengensis TaxID=2759166 RepID=A0A7W4QDY5_9GAMM|nr:OmpA family protein [Pseudomonas ullengensis]